MAITIRGTTPATVLTNANPVSLTLTGARQPQAGDRLIIIHANDYYLLTDMPTPSVGGSTSGVNALAVGTHGDYSAKAKGYYKDISSTGDLTVSVTELDGGEEKSLTVYVLFGHNAGVAPVSAGGDGDSATQVAPTVTASGPGLLLCHTSAGTGVWAASYTPPSGMTETHDQNDGAAYSIAGASLVLASGGATGTKSFTAASSTHYATLSISLEESSGAGPADTSGTIRQWFSIPRSLFGGFRSPFLVPAASFWPAEAVGVGHTVDQADDVGLTDSTTIESGKAAVQTDSAGLTDAVVLGRALERTDSVGLTDSAPLTLSGVYTDSAGLTDSATVQSGKAVTQTDDAGLTDAIAVSQAKVLADSAGLTDTSSVAAGKLVTQTDDAGLTDAALLLRSLVVTDSAGLTDARSLDLAKVQTDSAGLTDSTSIAAGKIVDLVDNAGLTDSQALARGLVHTDSAGLTDAPGLTLTKTVTDGAGLTDGAAAVLQRAVEATDSAGLTDSTAFARALGVTDSAGLTDASVLAQSWVKILTDSAGLTDSAVVLLAVPVFYGTAAAGQGLASSGRAGNGSAGTGRTGQVLAGSGSSGRG